METRTSPSVTPACANSSLGETGMRGGLGMAHQRLHAAQRNGVARDAQVAQKFERRLSCRRADRGKTSRPENRIDCARSGSAPDREQRRIQNLLDLRMRAGAPRCARRSCSSGSCAARRWAGGCPASSIRRAAECCRTGCASSAFSESARIAGKRDAGNQIAEAGEILGGRVQHEVGAQFAADAETRARAWCCPPSPVASGIDAGRHSVARRMSVMTMVGLAGVSISTMRRFFAARMVASIFVALAGWRGDRRHAPGARENSRSASACRRKPARCRRCSPGAEANSAVMMAAMPELNTSSNT